MSSDFRFRPAAAGATGSGDGAGHGSRLRFATCDIDLLTREVRRDGVAVRLRPRVFDLLVALIEQRPRVVPRQELLRRVWGRTALSDSVLARAVMEARRAIGDSAAEPRLIVTTHSVGYRFGGALHTPAAAATGMTGMPPGTPATGVTPGRAADRLLPALRDRAGLLDFLAAEHPVAVRSDLALCVAMFGLHPDSLEPGLPAEARQRTARQLGQVLRQNCRQHDLPTCIDAETFALVLCGVGPTLAQTICERLRRRLQAMDWSGFGLRHAVPLGIALADLAEDAQPGSGLERLRRLLDSALHMPAGAIVVR